VGGVPPPTAICCWQDLADADGVTDAQEHVADMRQLCLAAGGPAAAAAAGADQASPEHEPHAVVGRAGKRHHLLTAAAKPGNGGNISLQVVDTCLSNNSPHDG